MQPTTDKNYYVAGIPPALLQHPDLGANAKLIGCCLLMHRNRESGLCYPTHETLALENNVTEKTVRRGLKELKDTRLVTWENREAPKGAAKGRANSYDLGGLDALRSIPIAKASEIADRTKATVHRTKTTGDSVRSRADKNDPSLRTNRAVTVNSHQTVLEATSASDGPELAELKVTVTAPVDGGLEPIEAGERTKTTVHSARTAQAGPLKGIPAATIRAQLLSPDGESAFDACTELDVYAWADFAVVGGEPLNPGAVTDLSLAYGSDLVWFHAKWFPVRVAMRKEPPRKPAAYFVECVRKDYAIDPSWLDRYKPVFSIPDLNKPSVRIAKDEIEDEIPF